MVTAARKAAARTSVRRRERARAQGELVLIVTDDQGVRRRLCERLAGDGYRSATADKTMPIDELARQLRPDVVVLDLDRVAGPRLNLLARIRDHSATPVIVLSTRATEGDKVAALDAGADDYVSKPFGAKELLARIRVALRYAPTRTAAAGPLEVGPIRIDPARHQVTFDGQPVKLTPTEFRILSVLGHAAGAVVTREQLMREVWGAAMGQVEHLRVHVAAVRKKLEPDPGQPRWLVTVAGVGYRLGEPQP